MLLLTIFQGHLEAPSLNPIARYTWVFPWVEWIHICGFSLLVGTIFILDMSLMGIFFRNESISKLARQLAPWITTGLVTVLLTGPYLLTSDAAEYVQVGAFRVKMALLVAALVFHYTVIRHATRPEEDQSPLPWKKFAAGVSLCLWLGIVVSGLWIGNL